MTGRPHGVAAGVPARVRRVRELAVAIGLVALAFAQSPGLVVADTKLDLVVSPGAFLRRALLAWDPHTGFGQLQNQAYGYLFPMGPFFLLGDLAGLPAWIVQRAWWSVVLVVAFSGMLQLTAALRVGTWPTRVLAAVAFSLSPRILTTLGALSAESWPLALAPWVLLPLVRCRDAGGARRAALTSALLFACVGAVNAVATLAVLLPPALWLATRAAGPARRRLAGWWLAGVALASAWWLLPLLVLGRYAYPFLDYIESARVTSSVTSVFNVLRGTSDWVAWSPSLGQPSWPAGWWLATATPAVLATSAVAALGLLGLARRDLPERRFLVLCLLAGVVLMAVAHGGPLAPDARALLDGPLAALRNGHKLDLLVRLPMAVGLAHLLAVGPDLVRRRWGRVAARVPADWGVPGPRPVQQAAAAVVGLALLVSVAPATGGDLAARAPFDGVPGYWRTAAAWLDAHPGGGRTLLAPATAFGDYLWGHPNDEPLVALTTTSVALRDAVPLGAPGATRLLDGVVDELAAARPSADLAPALAAAGIGRVLLRGDVDPRAAADPVAAVRTTLSRSPGLHRVAVFGPRVAESGLVDDLSVAPPDRRALEVWAVDSGPAGVRATPLTEVRRLAGGPESALGRAGAGVAGAPTVADDIGTGPLPALVTDTLRRRQLDFGAVPGSAYGPTLRAADPVGADRAAGDLLPAPDDQQTVARYAGGAAVTASSSAADPTRPGWRGAGARPAAALDGDGRTAWVTSDVPGRRWLQVRWRQPHAVGPLEIIAPQRPGPDVPTSVRVVTDGGAVRASRGQDGRLIVTPPPGPTRRVRLQLTGSTRTGPLTVTDVVGLTVRESLAVPRALAADAATDVWVLRRSASRSGCMDVGPAWACSPALVRAGEDGPTWRRTLRVEQGGPVAVRAVARPVPGPLLDAALDRALGYRAAGSSAAVDHPAARPGAAFDGDPATGWVATAQDATPTVTLTLPVPATLTRVSLRSDAGSRARLSTLVVAAGGEERRVAVRGRSVRSRIEPLTGRTFRFTVARAGDTQPQPIRIDFDLSGLVPEVAGALVSSPCEVGPELRVGGQVLRFAVSATPAQVLSGAALPAMPCAAGVQLPDGRPTLEARSSAVLALDQVTLGTLPPVAPGREVRTVSQSAEHRVLSVASGPASLVVLDEGANAGWRATVAGRTLHAVTVDGWRQGWLLSTTGRATIRLDFEPGRWHRGGLAAGLAALVMLLALGVAERRRGARPPGEAVTAAAGWRWEPTVLALAAGAVLGGAGGLLVAVLAVAVRALRPGLAGPLAALSLMLAGAFAAGSDRLAGGGPARLTALLSVLLVVSGLRPVPVRRHRAAEPIEQRSLEPRP